MTFNPDSTIYLCNAPIDNTYKHQIKFASATAQQTYFINKRLKTFSNYLVVRKTLPAGGMESRLKVDSNIDDLQGCNYMMYRNTNHGAKWFYAFITRLVYVSEGTTEIIFETDVWQTWQFDIEILKSYVVREHSKTDEVGANVVPEKFNIQDYKFSEVDDELIVDKLTRWGYLVASTEYHIHSSNNIVVPRGGLFSGVYQGMYFYYYEDISLLSNFLDYIEEKGDDCVQFITLIPKFNLSQAEVKGAQYTVTGAPVSDAELKNGQGCITYHNEPAHVTQIFNLANDLPTDGGKVYKNKKLYTSPFYNFVVTNHSGDECVLNIEDFKNPAQASFNMYGDISANPSVTLVPVDYKGIHNNVDFSISLSGFPQCAFNSDTYKLWLAKNQYGVAISAVANGAQIVGGVVAMATGAGAVAGASMIATGATGVLNTVNSVYQASKEPNRYHAGAPKNNLLTAMKKNRFEYHYRYLKKNQAKTIDDFFTMYGYQTNELKIPNLDSRPVFNYVETIDVNIIGGIPDDDMRTLKAMFNNGVTLWKPTATVGDYSADNSPK